MSDKQKELFSIEITEQAMDIKEVAKAMNVAYATVQRSVKELYPDCVKNGVKTKLSEYQVTRIKEHIFSNRQLFNPEEVTTDLEMSEMTMKVLQYHADKIKELQKENQIMKPKAVEYDKFMSGKNVQTMNEVSKVLGIGHKKLMKLLRDSGILMKNNTPYQEYAHYFKVIEKPIPTGENKPVTLVKPEGVNYISKKILN